MQLLAFEPGGFPAIRRWSSVARPPVRRYVDRSNLEGSQKAVCRLETISTSFFGGFASLNGGAGTVPLARAEKNLSSPKPLGARHSHNQQYRSNGEEN
jgi:hypothetical protein